MTRLSGNLGSAFFFRNATSHTSKRPHPSIAISHFMQSSQNSLNLSQKSLHWLFLSLKNPYIYSPLVFSAGFYSYMNRERLLSFSENRGSYAQPDNFIAIKRPSDPFKTFQAADCAPSDKVSRTEIIDDLEKALHTNLDNSMPDMFSIKEIMSWANPVRSIFGVEKKSDINDLPVYLFADCNSLVSARFHFMNGAVRQVAGQFNLGEARYRCLTHPREFAVDPTQGPSEQRTAVVAAVARWVHRKESDSLSELQKSPLFSIYFDYKFGRLTPIAGKEAEALQFLKNNVDKIRLNVQRVKLDGGNGKEAIQVINAAPALGVFDFEADAGKRSSEGLRLLSEISTVLLVAQYKAVAAVTIMEARKNPAKSIPISLTRVGGYMFGNDESAITAGICAAYDLIKRSRLENIVFCLSAQKSEEVEGCLQLPFMKNRDEVAIVTEEAALQSKTLEEAAQKVPVKGTDFGSYGL